MNTVKTHFIAAKGDTLVLTTTTTTQYIVEKPNPVVMAIIGDGPRPIDEKAAAEILGTVTGQPARVAKARKPKVQEPMPTEPKALLVKVLGRSKVKSVTQYLKRYGIAAVNRYNSGSLTPTNEKAIAKNPNPGTTAFNPALTTSIIPAERGAKLAVIKDAKSFIDLIGEEQAKMLVDLPSGAQAVLIVGIDGRIVVEQYKRGATPYARRGDICSFGRKAKA